jgi:hypothetical protein
MVLLEQAKRLVERPPGEHSRTELNFDECHGAEIGATKIAAAQHCKRLSLLEALRMYKSRCTR